ncbi:uncharacterized protein F5Z01DRAFT_632602 [Emericellopsis atlantica]|uniref:GPI anchored protein n=1 Tax=Emericellopsis atlantica TaxID=2614577 RepID=A0A9P8CSW0_9HYPO|nr:uncharacterized protein F5Z01DRAFT_632602 [Emericellopsis atlantica]KAG9258524.1 hypothetical protein F5Z01DRAFT_632602 [Emericellopsis atlantica]
MQFSNLFLAILPALALASEGPSTSTCTSTTTLTKTLTLSSAHTVTSSVAVNSTTPISTPTSSSYTMVSSSDLTSLPVETSTSSGEEPATVTDDSGASGAVSAGKVILAGVMGMVVVGMM